MNNPEVFQFLAGLVRTPDILAALATEPKEAVLAEARTQGYTFDEAMFDSTLWETEIILAKRIGEPFDFSCSMWETMWGKAYLEYLATVVAPIALLASET